MIIKHHILKRHIPELPIDTSTRGIGCASNYYRY